jgi:hypothetical protein
LPLSAMAANHGARFGLRSHARIAGLSALLKISTTLSSNSTDHIRSVSGGLPDMVTTHASQTTVLSGARTRFCPTKVTPIQSMRGIVRDHGSPHTQQSPEMSVHLLGGRAANIGTDLADDQRSCEAERVI